MIYYGEIGEGSTWQARIAWYDDNMDNVTVIV